LDDEGEDESSCNSTTDNEEVTKAQKHVQLQSLVQRANYPLQEMQQTNEDIDARFPDKSSLCGQLKRLLKEEIDGFLHFIFEYDLFHFCIGIPDKYGSENQQYDVAKKYKFDDELLESR